MIIYPTRSIEQSNIHPHRSLLNGDQVHRVYLDELGNIRQLPLWVALMVLTTVEESQAPEEARYLLSRTRQEVPSSSSRAIVCARRLERSTVRFYEFSRFAGLVGECSLNFCH